MLVAALFMRFMSTRRDTSFTEIDIGVCDAVSVVDDKGLGAWVYPQRQSVGVWHHSLKLHNFRRRKDRGSWCEAAGKSAKNVPTRNAEDQPGNL
jgi:hypothetical protein